MKTETKDKALKELEELKSDFEKRSSELKRIIEDSDKKTIFQRVTDIPSAIAEIGESHKLVKEYRTLQKSDCSIKSLRRQQIAIFAEAMNEGVKMTWKNENQTKYFPWFDGRKAVNKGFFISDCSYWNYLSSGVPADHAYETKEKALHAGKCIEQTYYDYIMND